MDKQKEDGSGVWPGNASSRRWYLEQDPMGMREALFQSHTDLTWSSKANRAPKLFIP